VDGIRVGGLEPVKEGVLGPPGLERTAVYTMKRPHSWVKAPQERLQGIDKRKRVRPSKEKKRG